MEASGQDVSPHDAMRRRRYQPSFDGTEASTWPFPETASSPVWEAWRQRRLTEQARVAASAAFWRGAGVERLLSSKSRMRSTPAPQVAAGSSSGVQAEEPLRVTNKRMRAARPSEVIRPARGAASDGLWTFFEEDLVQRFIRAGLSTLGDIAEAKASGRRWWIAVAGIGPKRAKEIETRVHALLNGGTEMDAAQSIPKRAAQWFPG